MPVGDLITVEWRPLGYRYLSWIDRNGVGRGRSARRPIPAVQAAISISRKQSVSSGPSNVDNGVVCGLAGFETLVQNAAVAKATRLWIFASWLLNYGSTRNSGEIRIGEIALLQPSQSKGSIEPLVADLLDGSRDYGNGFEWLFLRGLTFGGQPAWLSICFHDGRFEQASWSVQLPDAPMELGWPTREAIDNALSFVRET